jgi:hypothetical protein
MYIQVTLQESVEYWSCTGSILTMSRTPPKSSSDFVMILTMKSRHRRSSLIADCPSSSNNSISNIGTNSYVSFKLRTCLVAINDAFGVVYKGEKEQMQQMHQEQIEQMQQNQTYIAESAVEFEFQIV